MKIRITHNHFSHAHLSVQTTLQCLSDFFFPLSAPVTLVSLPFLFLPRASSGQNACMGWAIGKMDLKTMASKIQWKKGLRNYLWLCPSIQRRSGNRTKSSKSSTSHLCIGVLIFDVHLQRVSYVVCLFHK